MTQWYLIPISAGLCIVVQGILNKQFSADFGLATAIFYGGIVFAILSVLLYFVALKFPGFFPEIFIPNIENYEFRIWHLIPGLCGFGIVLLIPWGLQHLNAAPVFLMVIAAQILFSFCYDHWINGVSFTLAQIGGMILVLAGAAIFNIGI